MYVCMYVACIYTERAASAQWFTKRFRAGMLGINIGIPVPRGTAQLLEQ